MNQQEYKNIQRLLYADDFNKIQQGILLWESLLESRLESSLSYFLECLKDIAGVHNYKQDAYAIEKIFSIEKLEKVFPVCEHRSYLVLWTLGTLALFPEMKTSKDNFTKLMWYEYDAPQLPSNFGNLSALTDISLYNGQLQSLPDSFGRLENLKRLYLSGNQLESLPNSFGNLTQLQILDLRRNPLKALTVTFEELEKLKVLLLDSSDNLPKSFGQLQPADIPTQIIEKTSIEYSIDCLNQYCSGLLSHSFVRIADITFETFATNVFSNSAYMTPRADGIRVLFPDETSWEALYIVQWTQDNGTNDDTLNVPILKKIVNTLQCTDLSPTETIHFLKDFMTHFENLSDSWQDNYTPEELTWEALLNKLVD